jgi:hypothetical protein
MIPRFYHTWFALCTVFTFASAIRFTNIATDPASGLSDYRRAGSPPLLEQLAKFKNYTGQVTPLNEFPFFPIHPNGQPGIAIFDYDNDGDDDILVPNGPQRANSLFKNLLIENGKLEFTDVGIHAGLPLIAQDCTGVCYGDMDNDGYDDVIILVRDEPNHIFRNLGDGTFEDRSGCTSGFGLTDIIGTSNCQVGDVNEDGLLDIHVGNTFDWKQNIPVFGTLFDNPFFLNQPDELFLNLGDFKFEDVSNSSGAVRQELNNITWAAVLWDYDGDGHLDIVKAQDVNIMAVLKGDGTGHFVDVTASLKLTGLPNAGGFMGIAIANFDTDGDDDMWVSNFGTYGTAVNITGRVSRTIAEAIANGVDPGDALDLRSTTGFNFRNDGTFERYPIIGTLEATPFGWGIIAIDYDLDGCHDILFYGGIDWGASLNLGNPGAILRNAYCNGTFIFDRQALDPATNHSLMVEHGVATGDFNLDGFPDQAMAVAAVYDNPDMPTNLVPQTFSPPYGSPFDDLSFNADPFEFLFENGPPVAIFKGPQFLPSEGPLVVEMNDASNDNHFVSVRLKGMVGLTPQGKVNRNGFGARILSTPGLIYSLPTASVPVLGGSSHASQDSSVKIFGLRDKYFTDIEVHWPGKIKNKLYYVIAGKRLVFPEIPCSFDDPNISSSEYKTCVWDALSDAEEAGFIDFFEKFHFYFSAIRAFHEAH